MDGRGLALSEQTQMSMKTQKTLQTLWVVRYAVENTASPLPSFGHVESFDFGNTKSLNEYMYYLVCYCQDCDRPSKNCLTNH